MRRNRNTGSSSSSAPAPNSSNSTNESPPPKSLSNKSESQIASQMNLVNSKEVKIRSLLKELQSMVKNCQDVRVSNEPHLQNIQKVHEKLKKEATVSQFYRKKLHGLYTTGLQDADNEIKSIKKSLDCIRDIRTLQSEIHLIKTNIETLSGHHGKDKPKASMRRGVLMSILQQASLTLPLWIGDIGEPTPPLCGCIPHEADYVCKQGDKVAAKVQNNVEENWILAEVVSYNSASCEYVVDDIDADEGQERHTLERNRVVPLPLWRANPITDKEAIFQKDATVLALYPQTTCFYRGICSQPPHTPQEDYLILFEDSSYIEGYSPPLNVAQLYVVASKDAN